MGRSGSSHERGAAFVGDIHSDLDRPTRHEPQPPNSVKSCSIGCVLSSPQQRTSVHEACIARLLLDRTEMEPHI